MLRQFLQIDGSPYRKPLKSFLEQFNTHAYFIKYFAIRYSYFVIHLSIVFLLCLATDH
jgi:hypothetical protein